MNKLDVLYCPGFYAKTEDIAIQAVHCSLIFDIDYDVFEKVNLVTYDQPECNARGIITYGVHDGILVVDGMSFVGKTGKWAGLLILTGADGHRSYKLRFIVSVENGIIQSLKVWVEA